MCSRLRQGCELNLPTLRLQLEQFPSLVSPFELQSPCQTISSFTPFPQWIWEPWEQLDCLWYQFLDSKNCILFTFQSHTEWVLMVLEEDSERKRQKEGKELLDSVTCHARPGRQSCDREMYGMPVKRRSCLSSSIAGWLSIIEQII